MQQHGTQIDKRGKNGIVVVPLYLDNVTLLHQMCP